MIPFTWTHHPRIHTNSPFQLRINSLASERLWISRFQTNLWLMTCVYLVILPSHDCQLSLLMISQNWDRQWLVSSYNKPVSEPVLTKVCRHMASPGHIYSFAPDKMAAILTDDTFKCIFLNENTRIPIWIALKFVPMSPIDNKPALVHVMAWRRTGDKPLPEVMLTQFTGAYILTDQLSQCFLVQKFVKLTSIHDSIHI